MKALMFAASAAAVVCAVPMVAAAQDAASAPTGAYGTLGYSDTHGDGANVGAIQGRLGYRFNPYLGVEGELAGGVKSDTVSQNVGGTTVTGKVKLDHQEALYGVGFLPVAPNWDLLGRVGYGHSEGKVSDVAVAGVPVSTGGVSDRFKGDSWNYGVGAQYHWDGQNGVRADYTREEFTHGSGHGDVWSIAYSRRF